MKKQVPGASGIWEFQEFWKVKKKHFPKKHANSGKKSELAVKNQPKIIFLMYFFGFFFTVLVPNPGFSAPKEGGVFQDDSFLNKVDN